MAGITLVQAESQLTNALTALDKANEAKEFSMATGGGSRSAQTHDIDKLLENVKHWQKEVQRLSRSAGGSVRRAVIT